MINPIPAVSVLMPTYNQAAFIRRAIESLLLQTVTNWELIIVNDGSTDDTEKIVKTYIGDERIRYVTIERNKGLGYALNVGLDHSTAELIAYLPSDDIYFDDHLQSLIEVIAENDECILSYGRIVNNRIDESEVFKGSGYLQLVQVMHKKTKDRWVERDELVTDNLNILFWDKLYRNGPFLPTNKLTAQWVEHPLQHSKLIREDAPGGGLPRYRSYFRVKEPIKFQSSIGSLTNEVELYKIWEGEKGRQPATPGGLKILLVGELAYNAERIYALEQYGHKLYGLWIENPNFYNTVGPIPFGNIEDIPFDHSWKDRVKEIKPDIIYALLNCQAIAFANYILKNIPEKIPFVWHFKEGPFFSQRLGTWKQLMEIFNGADGLLFINEENRNWYSQFITFNVPTCILDGDLPKSDWFTNNRSDLLSDKDGEIHTVIPGRPYGINPYELTCLADQKVHIHIYGEHYHNGSKNWVTIAKKVAENYIHLHPTCIASNWVTEFSKYDAGWLHCFDSYNKGELMKASWNDLNYPARMNTLAAAGLPMILKNNEGHMVAVQNLAKRLDVGVCYDSLKNIREVFEDREKHAQLRNNVWKQRAEFSFDHHVKKLTDFFHTVIKNKQ
jgi:glycosyltransferase involved in cell wall biosynthesis